MAFDGVRWRCCRWQKSPDQRAINSRTDVNLDGAATGRLNAGADVFDAVPILIADGNRMPAKSELAGLRQGVDRRAVRAGDGAQKARSGLTVPLRPE